ncbi:aminoacyl-tRNA hydrolase [Candidatus Berkelbacteria bacterium]|nr:aminoacyl-tRNA hydrolase [Candidatus Berkelbacteria bacterium]
MKLIVGLGNPGKEYAQTRHNVGWMVLDRLAEQLGTHPWSHSEKFTAELAEIGEGIHRTILLKPTTFMNNSGRAVERLRHFSKLEPADIVVVHDELALPLGSMRVRLGGTSAGHNGVGSIIHHLGTEAFWRVRIGIEQPGATRPYGEQSDFVLGRFSAEERVIIAPVIDRAVALLVDFSSSGTLSDETITIPAA